MAIEIPSPLVTTDWLAAHLDDPALRILDASVLLAPDAPHLRPMRDAHRRAHIPGAVFADLVHDVVELDSPFGITRPGLGRAAEVFGRLGVGDGTAVVVYDNEFGQNAARLWWILKAAGHTRVALLDGGLRKWTAELHPTASGETTPAPAVFTARPRTDMWADRAQVLDAIANPGGATLVNAVPELPDDVSVLPPGAAQVMSISLPGSRYVPFPSLGQPGTEALPYPSINWPGSPALRPRPDRRRLLEHIPAERPAIVYCNSGLNAPLVALCLVDAGHTKVSVYDGGLMEWLSNPNNPTVPRPSAV